MITFLFSTQSTFDFLLTIFNMLYTLAYSQMITIL